MSEHLTDPVRWAEALRLVRVEFKTATRWGSSLKRLKQSGRLWSSRPTC